MLLEESTTTMTRLRCPAVMSVLSALSYFQGQVTVFATRGSSKQSIIGQPSGRQDQQRVVQQVLIQNYKILNSAKITARLKEYAEQYPNFVILENSQESFGLPAAGEDTDCKHDHDATFPKGCKNWFLTIEDKLTHPKGSDSSKRLPEVYLSGALHGNERVGPTAVTEVAALLLEAASCEAKPEGKAPTKYENSTEVYDLWIAQLTTAHSCREELATKGINGLTRKWLARLVSTRRIVIIPSANALGYSRTQRQESDVDPNRDFPFDLTNSSLCMQTIAGRTVNEIYRRHMFQLSLTFHAGSEVVAYEWGAPTYANHLSPDDEAQKQIAAGYSRYGGGWEGTTSYATGTMHDQVYDVRGGMEDWAYAGSWDPERVIQCNPSQYGGYPKDRTIYNNSTLRVFNMLVEASNQKIPLQKYLGTNEDTFNADTIGNGHISRNIRLSLLAIELVEPYVFIVSTNGVPVSDDIVPLTDRTKRSCQKTKAMRIPPGQAETVIQWTVGGGMSVDFTTVLYAKWDDIPKVVDGLYNPKSEELGLAFEYALATNGTTRWHENGANPRRLEGGNETQLLSLGPVFTATIDTRKFRTGDKIAVLAMARLDHSWKNQPKNIQPAVPPMSHIVNARTNPEWKHYSADKIIEGRVDWYSIPLTLVIGSEGDDLTIELYRRLEQEGTANEYFVEGQGLVASPLLNETDRKSHARLLGTVALLSILLVAVAFRWRKKMRREIIKIPQDEEDEEFVYDHDLELPDIN